MPSLILRDIPEEVHERLRARAERNHRSMTREAVAILEKELGASGPVRLPPAVVPLRPLTAEEIDRAIDEGRT